MIMVLFLTKNSRTATMCELVRNHGAKFMIGFFTILCVSDAQLAHNYKAVILIDRMIL